jgi:hypothetical protein
LLLRVVQLLVQGGRRLLLAQQRRLRARQLLAQRSHITLHARCVCV